MVVSLKVALDASNKTELRRCVKVEVVVLGSSSVISLVVSVDVKHNKSYGFCGRKA